jgi:hypothetical protein
VKSGKEELLLSGMDAFSKKFNPKKMLLIGEGGIALSQFFEESIEKWTA